MKIIYKSLLFVAALSGTQMVSAETWSLEQCVEYAVTNNFSVRNSLLNITDGEQSVIEAKDRFLPSINASASEGVSFGRGLTASNTYADRNTSNLSWGASLNLPLFQGLSEYRQLKVAKSNLQKLLYEHEAVKDNITLNVITQYLQVLYAKEVCQSARRQLEHTTY